MRWTILGRGWPLLLALTLASGAAAQDAHYWSRQFGNRAWLLGGSLMGAPADISAVYYNPGALALLTTPEFELSGSVVEYSRITVANGLGPGKDLTTSRINVPPALLAGTLRFGWLGRARMGYAFITREGFDTRLQRQDTFSGMDVLGISGLQSLSTDVRLEQGVREYWTGVSLAYPLGRFLGVGITPFLAVRDEHASLLAISQGAGNEGQLLLATLNRDYRMQHARFLAKLGISYQEPKWAVGLTVTLPSLSLWGKGEATFERALAHEGLSLGPLTRVSDFQQNTRATFRSPLAVGLGGNRTFGSTTVHAAVEAFAKVAPFRMVDTRPIELPDGEELPSADIFYGLDPVVNAAVGVEQRLAESLRAYVSFHTDFSGAVDLPNTSSLLSTWDLYHWAMGFYFRVGYSRVTLGTDLAWGRRTTQRLTELLAQSGLPPTSEGQGVRYFQATLILGATFGLDDPRPFQ
ncbi:hypothetical protein KRR26_06615 [Corallococcus sp. M34]|uniref:hypothetical protein n=1 Tax=Citreicoccus inhibens TaxID=2849499 RepID=UPI001C22564D|nr:hypothetical protein [Citreicoccus inhibens]MBU8895270.1 hypothetical protein [Citreicoccus inhibens]